MHRADRLSWGKSYILNRDSLGITVTLGKCCLSSGMTLALENRGTMCGMGLVGAEGEHQF